jgi:hypothetical protein
VRLGAGLQHNPAGPLPNGRAVQAGEAREEKS